MGGAADRFTQEITAAEAHLRAAHEKIASALRLAREFESADHDVNPALLDAAEMVGRSGQAHDGELIQLLAEAHRVKANPGGLVPWIATHLDVTQGAARGIAQSAREIGHLPELTEALSSGDIGASSMRALTRTARAVKNSEQDLTEALAETLALSTTGNVGEANRHVRTLEETLDPGHAEKLLARQRRRSFARFTDTAGGMTRIEALVDTVSATTIRAAIDLTVSAGLRARQYDKTELVPEDVRTVEQLQAHALTRLAEVYLAATTEQRGATFTAPALYHAPLDAAQDAGLAETLYGQAVPRDALPPMGNPAAHLLEHVAGQPTRLDNRPLDRHPTARLASSDQRIALAWRDKTCIHPGCDRPPTWSLHSHHVIPYSSRGPTTMRNLALLRSEHHTLAHHPGV